MKPGLRAAIEATGAEAIDHMSGRTFAQFRSPKRVDLPELDRLLGRHRDVWLRRYSYDSRAEDVRYLRLVPRCRQLIIDHVIADDPDPEFLPAKLEALEIEAHPRAFPLAAIAARRSLRSLNLHTKARKRDYPLLAQLDGLEYLSLMGARLEPDVARALFGGLRGLRHLVLSNCHLDLRGVSLKQVELEIFGGKVKR